MDLQGKQRDALPAAQVGGDARHGNARRRQPLAHLGAGFGLAVVLMVGGCVDGELAADDPGTAPFALTVRALTSSCGGTLGANPIAEVQSYTLVVRDEAGSEIYRKAVPKSGTTLTAAEVPAGSGRELSLLGNVGGAVKWYARRSGQKIVKNTTSDFDMTLMSLDSFTCISPEAGAAANVLLPAVTPIGRGQVLISGGFGVAVVNGTKTELTGAQDTAWIFDAESGVLREVKNKARMKAARAGHNAIFLPKSNRVLIVGGAQRMVHDSAVPGPPTWSPSDGVNLAYEVFDVETETFNAPKSNEFAVKRVLPNLMPISDDYVVSLGGGVWPISKVSDPATYMNSNLYDPTEGSHGAFVKVGSALPLNAVRSGAAIASLGSTPDGGAKYLIWGGDDGKQRAEVFRESTDPGDGIFDGGFVVAGDVTSYPGGLHFASLTATGDAEVTIAGVKRTLPQFLSVGGVRHDGKNWLPPNKDDVYIVTVDEEKHRIETQRVAGFDVGIYLHQAHLSDAGHVVVAGGFSDHAGTASFTLREYDVKKRTFSTPKAAGAFVKRGGHGALTLTNDCMLMFGGVASYGDLVKPQSVASDIYCPGHLLP